MFVFLKEDEIVIDKIQNVFLSKILNYIRGCCRQITEVMHIVTD